MAALSVTRLPQGARWRYELKLDGYRALVLKDGKRVRIRSRNDKDLTRLYPEVVAAALRLSADRVVLDGEVVALDEEGRPSFEALQHRTLYPNNQLVFYAFDVLHHNGHDTTGEPLMKRCARLEDILTFDPHLRASEELPGRAARVVKAVKARGLEGVIAKRRDSRYRPGGRSGDWRKLKLDRQQELVIGGYQPDGPTDLNALLVGYYLGRHLHFAGKVRAGLVPHGQRDLIKRLRPLHRAGCPFENLPDATTGRWGGGITEDQMGEMQWVRPRLVAQVRFVGWTAEGRLRHAAFLGLRRDKTAKDVLREA